jgi:hypothetical protein
VRRLLLLGLIGLGVAVATASASAGRVQRAGRFTVAGLQTGPATFHDNVLSGSRSLQATAHADRWGGQVTASDGEVLQIYISDAYPVDPTVTQSLADFMVQLYHGDELAKAIVYVAPPSEVEALCGFGAGGCYDPQTENIVVPGETLPDGTTKETILVHELGHNLARNRLNPPWTTVDFGTKRWASAMNVCARTAAGTAFPGDEGANYRLNPGEALAESYRVLNFEKQSWPNWTVLAPLIVDQSFAPTSAALQALQQDVLNPWTGPTIARWSGRIANVKRAVKRVLASPLDGSFSIKLTRAPAGASISLVDTKSGRVLAKGARRAGMLICGSRSLTVLVRAAKTGVFSATSATP